MDDYLKLSLCNNESLVKRIEINYNDPIFKLLVDIKEIYYIIKYNKSDIIQFLYLSRKSVHKLLYENDEILEINSPILRNKLSNYFFLSLLIKFNTEIVDYEYSIALINDLNNRLKSETNINFKSIIISKLILELIDNYKLSNENDENINIINDIISFNRNILFITNVEKLFKKIELYYDEKNFLNHKIDKIYIDIINNLIKINKFKNSNYCYNIINQLDLENINITETMFNELNKLLNDNNINKIYLISNEKDFVEEKIHFYYILFKYILKNPFYIYHIPFLLNMRKNILKLIKENKLSFVNFQKKENKLKIEKIIEFITDSKYYFSYFEKNNKENEIINSSYSTLSLDKSNKNRSIIGKDKTFNKINRITNLNNIENLNKSKLCYNEIFNIEKFSETAYYKKNINEFLINDYLVQSKYEIIKFIKTIYLNKNNDENNKDHNKSKIRTVEFMKNIVNNQNNYYLSGGINSQLYYYDSFLNPINEIKIEIPENYNYYIGEYNDNKVLFFSKKKICLITIKLENPSYEENDLEPQNYEFTQLNNDEINNSTFSIISNQSKILMSGKEGIFLVEDLDSKIIKTKVSKLSDNPTFFGIKLDKIGKNFAFISNEIIKTKNNKLFFFSQNIKGELEKNKINSFSMTLNSLYLMKINLNKEKKEKIKFLLCACKKYTKFNKNGIYILKLPKKNDFLNIDENFKKDEYFYDTGNFQVYCFCQILEVINNNVILKDSKEANYNEKVEVKYTQYLFVGGYETGIGKGKIKLFKLLYNEEEDRKFKIEYIQDIIIKNSKGKNEIYDDKYHVFKKFGGPISSIIQSKITGNIVVTCLDGNVYLFSPPNLSILEVKDMKFDTFFNF